MLTNMTGVMSDRASVMKSFGRKFNETLQKELGETDNLEFLHGNSHFLLGSSTASEKTLSSSEKEIGEDLGRDKLTLYFVTQPIKQPCFICSDRCHTPGRSNPALDNQTSRHRATINIVLRLLSSIPYDVWHKIYCDNWLTSVALHTTLSKQGIACLGTV